VNLDDFNVLAAKFGQVVAPAASTPPVFGGTKIGGRDNGSDRKGEDPLDDLLA
jgi:hypothetical protein